jgi:hypothetical protein
VGTSCENSANIAVAMKKAIGVVIRRMNLGVIGMFKDLRSVKINIVPTMAATLA